MQTFLNQLVYFGFFQSLFLLIVYLFSAKNRKSINGYLAFLVFVLLIGLSGRVLYLSGIFGQNFRLITFSEFAILLFGATIYLFTQSSLTGNRFSVSDLVHYIPGFCYIVFIIYYFMLPSDEIIVARIKSGELYRVVSIFVGIGLTVNITYWAASLYQFLKFKKQLLQELSYSIKTQFFFNFLLAIGLCLFSWLIIYIMSLFGDELVERETRQLIWLSIAFIILFISFYSMSTPELFRQTPLKLVQKYVNSKLSSSDLNQLKKDLATLMEEKKPYLNNKLLKAELAEMMGISNPELARLLNERIGMNFFEYVNYYRIKAFIELAKSKEGKNMTFFGLAQEVGFNSKTTFNKSFKKLMGSTPKQYLSQH